ncbi:hypothetical protein SEVIR_9G311250v4 [Setaria viridis]|uniref:Secreted protein n=1 Tax=Setaria viridis TaxID=4556 RepID=A0A4U6SZU5_SETVI|nr:hypothetical protein SEVIR_9G311250v2 [Setaria viridis]
MLLLFLSFFLSFLLPCFHSFLCPSADRLLLFYQFFSQSADCSFLFLFLSSWSPSVQRMENFIPLPWPI